MQDCLFCRIVKGELPSTKIYEDEHTFAFLDIHPLNDGHTLVVPKVHTKDIVESSSEIFVHMMRTVHKLTPIIKRISGANAINIGINNGASAGQVIFHMHTHIIPRMEGDGYVSWRRNKDGISPLEETQKKCSPSLGNFIY